MTFLSSFFVSNFVHSASHLFKIFVNSFEHSKIIVAFTRCMEFVKILGAFSVEIANVQ